MDSELRALAGRPAVTLGDGQAGKSGDPVGAPGEARGSSEQDEQRSEGVRGGFGASRQLAGRDPAGRTAGEQAGEAGTGPRGPSTGAVL